MQGPFTHTFNMSQCTFYLQNLSISPIHRADTSGHVLSLASCREMAWGRGVKGRSQLKQGSHFFTFWDKETDFFLSLN